MMKKRKMSSLRVHLNFEWWLHFWDGKYEQYDDRWIIEWLTTLVSRYIYLDWMQINNPLTCINYIYAITSFQIVFPLSVYVFLFNVSFHCRRQSIFDWYIVNTSVILMFFFHRPCRRNIWCFIWKALLSSGVSRFPIVCLNQTTMQ